MTTRTKKACLVYVTSTAGRRPGARASLEAEGYEVCEVLADFAKAIAAEAGKPIMSADLKACIDISDLCVFLLPEDAARDGCIGAGGGYASELGKPFIAVIEGGRDDLPAPFDADAAGVVRDCDEALTNAIQGDSSFKCPNGSNAPPRKTDHIKCQ